MPNTNAPEEMQLFEQCRVCVVCSKELNMDTAQQLASTLEEHGADPVIYEPPSPFPSLEEFTHIMSCTIDFPLYDVACDALIPVVKPTWLHASLHKKKLANPRQYSPDPRLFLNDVVVTCGDIPEGDKDAIIGGVLAKGGLYSPRPSGMTTHLVDLTADSDKARVVAAKKMRTKIVLPHWFDDCLKLGRRIDERPYMLPDPEILRAGYAAPIRSAENKDIVGASTPEPSALPTPSRSSNNLDVFDGKHVMLSDDLGIGAHLKGSIASLIKRGGGTLTDDVAQADMVICRYREGLTYRMASRLNKDVGNLSWLYHLITYNTWTSPLRRLLHYPVSRTGIPEFKGLRISLSNYIGEARTYLENLIHAAGAECTKTLRSENTHLITAHDNSEKCEAARDWKMEIVNHLWLEESYAKWKLQPVSDPRYSHFPRRTNLGEVVGQTRLDKTVLENLFYPSEDTQQDRDRDQDQSQDQDQDQDQAQPSPRRVMQNRDHNAATNTNSTVVAVMPPPEPSKNEDAKTTSKAEKNATPRASEKTQKRPAEHKKLMTPAGSKHPAEGKKDDTPPSSTSSRRSKDTASARLHNLAPDIALYEKEKKRVGGVLYGGRRKSHEEKPAQNGKKRPSMEPAASSESEDATTNPKRQKKTRSPIKMRLLISGYQDWVGNIKKEDADKRRLRDLGILIVQDAKKCSHLAAPAILRTPKFVHALAYGPIVIKTDFITQCLKKDELLNPSDFPLVDKPAENRFKFSLAESITKARKNKNRLLEGYHVYCVESIKGGPDTYKTIVESNGGSCAPFRGRLTLPRKHKHNDDDDSMDVDEDDDNPGRSEIYLLSSVLPDQKKLWPRFRQMVKDVGDTPRVVRVDWLLDIAMSQRLHTADAYELDENSVE